MSKYKEQDFKECRFNPLVEGDMIDLYPAIANIVEQEWQFPELDSLIRFIILCYDDKSVLCKTERSLVYRKKVAFDLAGVKEDVQESVADFKHPFFINLQIAYLRRFVKSKEVAALAALEENFYQGLVILEQPTEEKGASAAAEQEKKSKIKGNINDDIKMIDDLYKRVFGDDEKTIEEARGRITPESLAMTALKK